MTDRELRLRARIDTLNDRLQAALDELRQQTIERRRLVRRVHNLERSRALWRERAYSHEDWLAARRRHP